MGENPIKETIRLKRDTYSSSFLELQKDGTALAIRVDDDDESNVEETVRRKYKYSYDDKDGTITMILERSYYSGFFVEEEGKLLTYGELCSKIDEDITVEKLKQFHIEYYKENKDDKYFKEDYPNCNSYEDFEKAVVKEMKEMGFDSFDSYIERVKQDQKNYLKTMFSVKITYSYEIDDNNKMTLTEKFTGLKNLVNSECRFDNGASYGYIDYNSASIRFTEDDSRYYYYGDVDTDNKTISFVSEEDREDVVEATYTENIPEGKVTIKFKGEEYICKFEADKYIQE